MKKWLDKYKSGGNVNSLNRKVTCSNCGWSWKLSDGGMDPMTCHKCGGDIKMQQGGELDKYQQRGQVNFRDQLFQQQKPIVENTKINFPKHIQQIPIDPFTHQPLTREQIQMQKFVTPFNKPQPTISQGTWKGNRKTKDNFFDPYLRIIEQDPESEANIGKRKRKELVTKKLPAALSAATGIVAAPTLMASAAPYISAPLTIGATTVPWLTPGTMIGAGFGLHGANQLGNQVSSGYYSSNAPVSEKIFTGVTTGLDMLGMPGAVEGLAAHVVSPLYRGALKTGNYLTTQTPLKNAYKINPWAFKPNPEAYYHRSPNLENIINQETGMLQGFGASEEGKLLNETTGLGLGKGISIKKTPHSEIYYSKGVPLDGGRTNMVLDEKTGRLIPGQFYKGPYMVEVTDVPFVAKANGKFSKVFNPETGQYVRGELPPSGKGNYAVAKRPISLGEAKFYKEDWLRGYKEVPKPPINKKGFSLNYEKILSLPDEEILNKTGRSKEDWELFIDAKPDKYRSLLEQQFNSAYTPTEQHLQNIEQGKKQLLDFYKSSEYNNRLQRGMGLSYDEALNYQNNLIDAVNKTEPRFIQSGNFGTLESDAMAYTKGADSKGTKLGIDFSKTGLERNDAPYLASHEYGHTSIYDSKNQKLLESLPKLNLDKETLENWTKWGKESGNKVYDDMIRYYSNPDEARQRGLSAILYAKNNGLSIDQLVDMPYSQVISKNRTGEIPSDIMQLRQFYDQKELKDYLKNLFSISGAAALGAAALQKQKKGGVIKDNRGQWAHPGEITQINSPYITMRGVNYPVLGVDNTGHTKMMQPGMNYTFPGQYVTEYPMMQGGGEMIKRADGSYSRRGLWDNLRDNRGSGKAPTKEMLEQERKIKNQYKQGGVVLNAGGEKHRIYVKTTNRGEGAKGHIMVNHPTMDKGMWDTIDLTEKAGATTIAQGVAATKKWHRENPYKKQKGGEQINKLKNINLNLPVIHQPEMKPFVFNKFLVNDRNQNLFIGGINPRYQNEDFSVGPYMIGVGNKYFQKFPADMGMSGTYHVNDNFDINMGVGQNNINAGIKYKFANGGYVVKSGDTLSKIARSTGVSIKQLTSANNLANPNLIRVNQKLVIPAVGGTQPEQSYQNWDDIRRRQDELNALQDNDMYSGDEQRINQYYTNRPDDSYIVIDKKRARMNVYKGNKLQKTYEVGTGANPGDAQTVTRRINGKTDWDSGNRSTGAGVYTISNIDPKSHEYFDLPAFNLKNDRGIEVATTIHGTPMARRAKFDNNDIADNRMSYGCINGKCYDLKDLYGRVDVGSKVYILPEDEGNTMQIVDGKPVLKVNPKNRAKYLQYTDKTGKVQKGQGINQSVNTLQYKPIMGLLDRKSFMNDVYQSFDTDDEEEYKKNTKPYFNSLVNNKKKVMQATNIPSDIYNEIAKISFGIYGAESNFGDENNPINNTLKTVAKVKPISSLFQSIANFKPTIVTDDKIGGPDVRFKASLPGALDSNKSVGFTQIRWSELNKDEKDVLKKLGILSNKDFLDPEKAAMATTAILAVRYNQQLNDNQKKDIWKHLPGKWNKRANYADRVKKNSKYITFKQYDSKYQDGGEIPQAQNGLETFISYLNPYNWGVEDYSKEKDFNKAYSSAKKDGQKEFMYNGKRYNTKYAGTPRQEVGVYGVQGKSVHPMDLNHPAQVNLYPEFGKYLPGHISASIGDNQTSVDYSRIGNYPYGINKVKNKGEKSFNVYGQDNLTFSNKVASLPTGDYYLEDEYRPSDWNLFTNNCADNVCDAFGIPRSKGIQTPKAAMQKIQKKYPTLDVTGRTYDDYYDLGVKLRSISFHRPDEVLNQAKSLVGILSSPDLNNTEVSKKITFALQNALFKKGYKLSKSINKDGELDGILGDETKAALEDWQKKNKMLNKKAIGGQSTLNPIVKKDNRNWLDFLKN